MEFECHYDQFKYIRITARFVHKKFGIDKNISFCLDTGCTTSFISYHQAFILGIPYDKLNKNPQSIKISGCDWDRYLIDDFQLIIRTTSGKLVTSRLNIMEVLGAPTQQNEKLIIPGILGYSFYCLNSLIVTKGGGRVYFTDKMVITK